MIEKIKNIIKIIISNHKFLFLIIGMIIGVLSGISSLLIIFLFPLIILSFLSNEKNTFLFLLLGFLIVYLPFVLVNHYLNPNERNISWNKKIKGHFDNIYSLFLNEVSLGETKIVEKDIVEKKEVEKESNIEFHKEKIIDNFEDTTTGYISFGENFTDANAKLQISSLGFGGKSLKFSFDVPVQEDMIIGKDLTEKNFKEYIYISFWIKSVSDYGLFEFIIEDEDGDWWHYFDDKILSNSKDWQKVTIELRSLENPDWTRQGNGKLNLESIRRFYFNFNSPEDELKQERYMVYIDEITLIS